VIGGDDINQTIHAVFAALLWHTPVLLEDVERYGRLYTLDFIYLKCDEYSHNLVSPMQKPISVAIYCLLYSTALRRVASSSSSLLSSS